MEMEIEDPIDTQFSTIRDKSIDAFFEVQAESKKNRSTVHVNDQDKKMKLDKLKAQIGDHKTKLIHLQRDLQTIYCAPTHQPNSNVFSNSLQLRDESIKCKVQILSEIEVMRVKQDKLIDKSGKLVDKAKLANKHYHSLGLLKKGRVQFETELSKRDLVQQELSGLNK